MEQANLADTLSEFEGLVLATARRFAKQVRREEDDLAQELRVRVWRAIETYNPAKSASLRGYVFGAVANKMRDFKRDAARRSEFDASVVHIEGFTGTDFEYAQGNLFAALYYHVTSDEVYAEVEIEPYAPPVDLTPIEHAVAGMLTLGFDRPAIAEHLQVTRGTVNAALASLRRKLAHLAPELPGEECATVHELPLDQAVIGQAGQLVA